ncbi:hypothetical protein BSPWISOXPB_4559 [uncultured Gammaproteobacteria bacterium]|nr:hypothetical protein BSPWISOXPB_4559 [uncultured Gammaproteobacteria bacterium]
MGQSRRGVMGLLEVQVSLLIMATLRFIQLMAPLPLLKVMGQSRRGVMRVLEAQAHLQ